MSPLKWFLTAAASLTILNATFWIALVDRGAWRPLLLLFLWGAIAYRLLFGLHDRLFRLWLRDRLAAFAIPEAGALFKAVDYADLMAMITLLYWPVVIGVVLFGPLTGLIGLTMLWAGIAASMWLAPAPSRAFFEAEAGEFTLRQMACPCCQAAFGVHAEVLYIVCDDAATGRKRNTFATVTCGDCHEITSLARNVETDRWAVFELVSV